MRACARIALISVALSTSFCIAACGAIDDLKDGTFRWLDVGKSPEPRVPEVPEATPMVPPDKPLRTEPSTVPKKNRKPAREVQRPQTTEKKLPTSDTPETKRPQRAEPQSVPSQPAPSLLRTPFPEAPPAGTFSR